MRKECFDEFLKKDIALNRPETNIHLQYARLDFDYEVHTHDFSELVIITNGSAVHVIDKKRYPVGGGDVFVISGDIPHGFEDVKALTLYNIVFRQDCLPVFSSKLKTLPGFHALFIMEPFYRNEHHFKSSLHLKPRDLKFAEEILMEMLNEANDMTTCFDCILENYFSTLVSYLSRQFTRSTNREIAMIMPLAEAVAYMEKNYTWQITLKQLSGISHFSAGHFIRIFKKIYGYTPIDYLNRLRIRHACALLKIPGESVSNIAMQSGFHDSNYFCRVFKKAMGLTPGEYKN